MGQASDDHSAAHNVSRPNWRPSQPRTGGLSCTGNACSARALPRRIGDLADGSGNDPISRENDRRRIRGSAHGTGDHDSSQENDSAVRKCVTRQPRDHCPRNGRAAVKLSCRGTVKCAGSLRLATKTRPLKKRHPGKTEIIAISKFAVAPDTTAIIELKLNAAGRSLTEGCSRAFGRVADRDGDFADSFTHRQAERPPYPTSLTSPNLRSLEAPRGREAATRLASTPYADSRVGCSAIALVAS